MFRRLHAAVNLRMNDRFQLVVSALTINHQGRTSQCLFPFGITILFLPRLIYIPRTYYATAYTPLVVTILNCPMLLERLRY